MHKSGHLSLVSKAHVKSRREVHKVVVAVHKTTHTRLSYRNTHSIVIRTFKKSCLISCLLQNPSTLFVSPYSFFILTVFLFLCFHLLPKCQCTFPALRLSPVLTSQTPALPLLSLSLDWQPNPNGCLRGGWAPK